MRVRAIRVRRVRRSPALDVAAVKLSLTNTGTRPAVFDSSTVLTVLNIPFASHSVRTMRSLSSRVHVSGFPSLERSQPVQPGATRTAWQRFTIEPFDVAQLNSPLASVSVMPLRLTGGLPRLGNIRLWSAATAEGAAAIQVRAS